MKIKDLRIKIAMVLTVIMMATPMIQASAADNNLGDTSDINKDQYLSEYKTESEYIDEDFCTGEHEEYTGYEGTISLEELKQQVEETKNLIREQYGTENKFQILYEDSDVKEEINGATGEYKLTNKGNNKVSEYNYFNELDQVIENIKVDADGYIDESEYMCQDDCCQGEYDEYIYEEYSCLEGHDEDMDDGYMDYQETISLDDLKQLVEEAKEVIKEQYGAENEFKIVYEDNDIKEEINGATGQYKLTDKKSNEVNEYNYYTEFDELIKNAENNSK